jgi:hypothetical protein
MTNKTRERSLIRQRNTIEIKRKKERKKEKMMCKLLRKRERERESSLPPSAR